MEIEIPDKHILPTHEIMILDTYGRHFMFPVDVLEHAKMRRMTDIEIASIAKKEIMSYILPSGGRVLDTIVQCPKSNRKKHFGPWLTQAFEDWEAEQMHTELPNA